MPIDSESLIARIQEAIRARAALLDGEHLSAVRLFNGFTEGCSDLAIDLYSDTVVFHNYADPPERGAAIIQLVQPALQRDFPWVRAGLIKTRAASSEPLKRGVPISSQPLARQVRENGLWYAIDLVLHQDCSLYLDTRYLRHWASEHLSGTVVLNTFAYTGSLGVAALGGGADRVIQLDRNRRFLELAKVSYSLNGFPTNRRDFIAADFFREAGRLRRTRESFGCVFLDPPFFASSPTGTVDQQMESARLINKVRPLVKPGGTLIAINNAVFVSGAAYMQTLESLCRDGHVEIIDRIPVPDDFVGFLTTGAAPPLTDPSPFNHSTKIVVLRIL